MVLVNFTLFVLIVFLYLFVSGMEKDAIEQRKNNYGIDEQWHNNNLSDLNNSNKIRGYNVL